jgi:hypothetical protein
MKNDRRKFLKKLAYVAPVIMAVNFTEEAEAGWFKHHKRYGGHHRYRGDSSSLCIKRRG